ncbi:hypothetical protein [Streptomyces sp. NPDC002685]|uniref:hypothetical protein n=1 Tax=Streptomyces sp. NPDC002685 TaxID=3154540 RepID=UPI0033228759
MNEPKHVLQRCLMALRFRTDVAVVQVRAVSVFLSFDGRGNTRAVPGRIHTKVEKLVNQENSGRVAVIAGTGADMDIPNGVIGSVRIAGPPDQGDRLPSGHLGVRQHQQRPHQQGRVASSLIGEAYAVPSLKSRVLLLTK